VTIKDDELLAFVRELTAMGDELQADTLLFSNGTLDSVAMVNLIAFVESRARIDIRAEDVTLDNFDTVARITEFVRGR